MKKTFLPLLIIMLAFVATPKAQTVDEMITKHIEARGGLEKIRNLKTMILSGSMQQAGNTIEMTYSYVNNKAIKVEFSVAGQTGYNIVTEKEGWVFNPFAQQTEAQAMEPEQLKDAQGQLDIQGGIVDYKSKGNTVEYLGKESKQGVEYYKLKLTLASGKVITYLLDKNYLVASATSSSLVQGTRQDVTTEYSDYRKTPDGYLIPFKRVTPFTEVIIEKAEINPKIDESIFKPSN